MVSTAEQDRKARAVPPALADELLIDAEVDDVPAPATPLKAGWLLVVSLVLIALNLRPALSSLGPVLKEIIADTGISAGTASLLTTAPVVCLGLFGVLAPRISRRLGTERAILALLLVLALGTALRGLGTTPALLLGAVLAGAGIGVTNVLLPGIVKRDFPDKAALMTGVYTMALCAGAAIAAGSTLPLARAADGSWATALAFWAIPAIIAAVVWLTQIPPRHGPAAHAGFTVRGLWTDPLAWQVTLFMGLQSSLAYSVFGWGAKILQDRGLDVPSSGLMLGLSILVQGAGAQVAPLLASKTGDLRFSALLMLAFGLAGLFGYLFAPMGLMWLCSVVLGIGQGGAFAVALTMIAQRGGNPETAARLSGMTQSVGYVMGALAGPLAVGLVHDSFGGWPPVAVLFTIITLGAAFCALGAGRVRTV